MSDRDYIIQEIKKIFKQKNSEKGILAQLAGKNLFSRDFTYKEAQPFIFRKIPFSIVFDQNFMYIDYSGIVSDPHDNLRFMFRFVHPLGRLNIDSAKVESSGSEATLKMSYRIFGRAVKKGEGQVREQELQKWLPILLGGKAVSIQADGESIKITPADGNPPFNFAAMATRYAQKSQTPESDASTSDKSEKPQDNAKDEEEKVMPAKDAKATDDFPFQEANVGQDFPKSITPGMDRGDPGFKKGGHKSINAAAIKILGSDPRVIYTAFINSGVIQANYAFKNDLSDLRLLTAKFQKLASEGKLRYQKKIDPSSKLTRALSYVPRINTQDLSSFIAGGSGFTNTATNEGVIAEKKKKSITVDGKIGSRTAALLLIYAKRDSFEKLKERAGVKKEPAQDSKNGKKPTRRKKDKCSPCSPNFSDARDIEEKTLLILAGAQICQISEPGAKENIGLLKSGQFTQVGDFLAGGGRGESLKSFIRSSRELRNKTIDNIIRISNNTEEVGVAGGPQLERLLRAKLSNAFVKFYSGYYQREDILMFAYFNVGEDNNIPIVYSTTGGNIGDAEGFLRATDNNRFMTITKGDPSTRRERRIKSIKDWRKLKEVKPKEILGWAHTHLVELKCYLKHLRAVIASGKNTNVSRYGEGSHESAQSSYAYTKTYIIFLEKFRRDLRDFLRDANEDNLSKLNLSANMIGAVQAIMVHGGKVK